MASDEPAGGVAVRVETTVGPDSRVEGWTWVRNSRKWHYYRECRAICGGMMMFCHPSEGYELGNDDSEDNCAACKRKLAAEKDRVPSNAPAQPRPAERSEAGPSAGADGWAPRPKIPTNPAMTKRTLLGANAKP